MLALGQYRTLLCPCGCGHLAEVSQDAAHEFDWKIQPVRCHARTALVKAQARQSVDTPEGLLHRAYLPE